MGFAWFQLRDAQVSENEVAIQILATDEEPGPVEEVDPGTEPDATGDDDALTEEPGSELPLAESSRVQI
jgi:hypothetical protein